MAIDQTILSADFEAVTDDLPVSFTWTDVSASTTSAAIAGTMGDVASSDKSFDAGFLPEFDAELHCQFSLIGGTPVKGDLINVVGGQTFQIEKIFKDDNDPIIRYGLITPNK